VIITQPKELIASFVNVQQGYPADVKWGVYTAMGLLRKGHLVAGVIYNCFEGTNANMHIGAVKGAKWLTQDFLFSAFDYPFNQLERRRVSACIRAKNKRAIGFVENLGFQYEGTQRHYYADDDMVMYGLLREQCRFLLKKAA